VQVASIKTRVESAPGFSQRLKLKCDEPLSDFAFNFNLRRYSKVGMLRDAKTNERKPVYMFPWQVREEDATQLYTMVG